MRDDSVTRADSMVREAADVETSSDGYAARFAGPVGAWMLSKQTQLVLDALRGSPNAKVVDIGGGHGQLAGPLIEAGYSVTVLGSAASCRHRIADLVDSGHCGWVVGDVLHLPFPDRSFDAVVCVRLLMNCEEWPRLIAELCRVARERVVVDYPTSQSLNGLAPVFFGAKRKLEGNTRHWRSFRHQELDPVFEGNGFVLNRRMGQFFWPMVLHRALRCVPVSRALEAPFHVLGLTAHVGSPVIAEFVRTAPERVRELVESPGLGAFGLAQS